MTRDLLTGLLRAGHRPMLFTRALGPLADELRAKSIPVADDIAMIGETPDIIHGQHFSVTTLAIARFPQVPAIFVCHDFVAWHDAPPRLPQVRRFAAISDGFRERLTIEGGVDPAIARVVLNAVDLDRYRPGPALPPRPRRALAFAKNLGHLPAVEAACAAAGLELEIVGGAVDKVVAPQDVMGDFDLVFASALTAIEAMATGRAVVVCDGRGLAGMVDPERYPGWRRENFGLRTLNQPLTAEAMVAEIARYDAAGATKVADRVRVEAGLPAWIEAWEALYDEAIAEHRAQPMDADQTARQMAAHLQTWSSEAGPGFPWLMERARLIDQARGDRGVRLLTPGETVTPTSPNGIELKGFHQPEAGGAWSDRPACSIGLRLGAQVRRLTLDYRLYFGAGRDRFDVELLGNGLLIERWRDDAGEESRSRMLEIDPALLAADGGLWLSLRTSAPRAPAEDTPGGDQRRLGFGLISLTAG